MRAAVLHGLNDIRLEEVPKPSYGDEDILIRVMACGICGSDLRILKHGNARVPYPAILGHEVAGIVEAVGKSVAGFAPGDRVAMASDIPCGNCVYCRAGHCNNCSVNMAIGHQYPGGLAEYLVVDPLVWKDGPFHRIPDGVSFAEAAVAEPLACAINGMDILPKTDQNTFVIIGGGVLGSLIADLARVYGYRRVMIADVDEHKLNLLKTVGVRADDYLLFDGGFRERVLAETGGMGASAVMVACGSIDAQRAAIDIVGRRGAVNLFAGLPPGTADLSFPSNLVHYREITITGSHGSVASQHKRALELIADKSVHADILITHRFPLSGIAEALALAGSPDRLKVIITPND
jgi:L-iditol 2-dehydrogenase